ncbi:MAG: sugar ABC transporter permease [Spirochaetota bacterium]
MHITTGNEKRRAILLFLLPSMLGLLLFSFIPMVASFFLSLSKWDGLVKWNLFSGIPRIVGFGNYKEILTNMEFWKVLGHTSYFIVLYIPLILVFSLLAANLLNNDFKGITAYRVLYYIPVLTSWVAGALVWKWVLSPLYGPLNELLRFIGLEGPGWLQDEIWAMPGIVLASIWKDMGFFGLIFLGALRGIEPEYIEAAKIDGAGWWKRYTKIVLPMLSPAIFFVVVISIINSFQLFPQIMIMTKDGDAGPHGATQVMVERIYKYAFRYFKMGYAAAYSWLLFVIIFGFTVIQVKLQRRWVHYNE